MSKRKADKTAYAVQITGEQITLIRSLELRIEQVWVHRGVSEQVESDGEVGRVPFWECHFCRRGSCESVQAIPHKKDCIVPLCAREFDALNAQFIEVLGEEATR